MSPPRIGTLSWLSLACAGISTVFAFVNLLVDLGGPPIALEGPTWIVTALIWSNFTSLLSREAAVVRLEDRVSQMEVQIARAVEDEVKTRLDEYEARHLLRSWGHRDSVRHLTPVD